MTHDDEARGAGQEASLPADCSGAREQAPEPCDVDETASRAPREPLPQEDGQGSSASVPPGTGDGEEPPTACTDTGIGRNGAAGRFHPRRLVSLSLLLTFVAVAITGIVLLLAPAHGSGRGIATVWGWRMHQWGELHSTLTVVVVVLTAAHLVLNARALWCYMRRPAGRSWSRRWLPVSPELAAAVPLSGLLIAAAVWWVPAADGFGTGAGRGRGAHARHGSASGGPRAFAGVDGRRPAARAPGSRAVEDGARVRRGDEGDDGRRGRGRRFRGGRGRAAD